MGAHKVVFCYKEKKCGGKKDTHMEGASGKDITSHEKHQVLHTETVNNWHHVMSVDTIFPLPAWHIDYKSIPCLNALSTFSQLKKKKDNF